MHTSLLQRSAKSVLQGMSGLAITCSGMHHGMVMPRRGLNKVKMDASPKLGPELVPEASS